MFLRFRVALAVLSIAACGDDDLQPDDLRGTWNLSVDAGAGCWPSFTLEIDIHELDALAVDDRLNISALSEWRFPNAPEVGGRIRGFVSLDGEAFEFMLLQGTQEQFHTIFRGGMASPAALDGTFSDPQGIFNEVPGCEASASATKE